MNTLTFKQIHDYVRKNDYVVIVFTAIGKNYVGVCLKHKTGNRKNTPDKPLKGRIYDEESFKILHQIYQVTKSIKFRYLERTDFHSECFYLFIKDLDTHLQMGGEINKEFFIEAVEMYKKQFGILKQVFK